MLRYLNIIKYWLKIINKNENKYVSTIHEIVLRNIEITDRKTNWVSLVKNLLGEFRFI